MKMNKKLFAAVAVVALGAGTAMAGGDFGGKHHGRMMEKFDTNRDGQLDEAEKQAMKAARQAKKAEVLAKYDANKDGSLDEAERSKLRADRTAERFNQLDTDKNGVLSLEEFKAAKPGGRHGRRGMR